MSEREGFSLNPGPQTWAQSSPATVIAFAGEAGGGKSHFLIHSAATWFDDPNYAAIIFRKTYKEIMAPGGLWELASQFYTTPRLAAVPRVSDLTWTFPSGAKVIFSHLEDFNVQKFRGLQVCFVAFDESNYMPESAVWLLFSRLRSLSQAPRKLIFCQNPDKDCWLRPWLDWYLDEYGYPREDRICKVRWFGRGDAATELQWYDSEAEALAAGVEATSFTFVPSKLSANPQLLRADPKYISKLKAMPAVDRLRFLEGCWDAQDRAPGDYFQRTWSPVWMSQRIARAAAGQPMDGDIRDYFWSCDFASTAVPGDLCAGAPFERAPVRKRSVDPDWTVILEWARFRNGVLCVLNCYAFRDGPSQIQWMLDKLVRKGHKPASVVLPLDPGQQGEYQMRGYQTALRGAGVRLECLRPINPLKAAEIASKEVASARVWCREGMLGEELFWQQLEQFPTKGIHDDAVSALALGVMWDLSKPLPVVGELHSMSRVGGDYTYRAQNDMRMGTAPRDGRRTLNDMSSARDFRRLL